MSENQHKISLEPPKAHTNEEILAGYNFSANPDTKPSHKWIRTKKVIGSIAAGAALFGAGFGVNELMQPEEKEQMNIVYTVPDLPVEDYPSIPIEPPVIEPKEDYDPIEVPVAPDLESEDEFFVPPAPEGP